MIILFSPQQPKDSSPRHDATGRLPLLGLALAALLFPAQSHAASVFTSVYTESKSTYDALSDGPSSGTGTVGDTGNTQLTIVDKGDTDTVTAEPGVTTITPIGDGFQLSTDGSVEAAREIPGGGRDVSGTYGLVDFLFTVTDIDEPYAFSTNYQVGITTGSGNAELTFSLTPLAPSGADVFSITNVVDGGTSTTPGLIEQSGTLTPGDYRLRIDARLTDTGLTPNTGIFVRWQSLSFGVAVEVIPEPSRALLLGLGCAFGILRRRRAY